MHFKMILSHCTDLYIFFNTQRSKLLKHEYHYHRYSSKDELHDPPSDDLLDNQNYATDQNHGLACKDKRNGPDEPK